MWDVRVFLVPLLLTSALGCWRRGAAASRGSSSTAAQSAQVPLIGGAVDWDHSAGVFIGIEAFRRNGDAPSPVLFASEDAANVAHLLIAERRLLPAAHCALLLSGQPHKADTQDELDALARETGVVMDSDATPVNAAVIEAAVAEQAQSVDRGGILFLFIATHGYTTNDGRHVLLTPDATMHDLKGIELSTLLAAIPAEKAGRVVLFVDACRSNIDPHDAAANPRAAMPARFFETLRLPGSYAVFTASRAGGFAYGDRAAKNGIFTRALLEALRCNDNVAGPEGYLTLAGLEDYVTRRVDVLSGGSQRPDARFGGLSNQPFIACGAGKAAGVITHPAEGATVPLGDSVQLSASRQELRATVVLCAKSGRCYNANPGLAPAPPATIPVQYGAETDYQVWVALSADCDFLRGETSFPQVPVDRVTKRLVYWLGPVSVTAAAPSDSHSTAE